MKIRQSQRQVERYGVSLSSSVAVEAKILAGAMLTPRGRRQQSIRNLLILGIQNQHQPLQTIQSNEPPVIGSKVGTSTVLMIHLNRRVPEDCSILRLIDALPMIRRTQTIRMWLSIGVGLTNDVSVEASVYEETPTSFSASVQMNVFETSKVLLTPLPPGKPEKEIKASKNASGKPQTEASLPFEGQKIEDNSWKEIVLDLDLGETFCFDAINVGVTEIDLPMDNDEVERIPATETVVSGDILSNELLPLDSDPSEIKNIEPESLPKSKNPQLVSMRGLFV